MDSGMKEIWFYFCLAERWVGLSHEMVVRGQPCSLSVQSSFQTSIILQVKGIYHFISEVSRETFPLTFSSSLFVTASYIQTSETNPLSGASNSGALS